MIIKGAHLLGYTRNALNLIAPYKFQKTETKGIKRDVATISVTCLIEFIQYFIGRSSDIDDILLNTFGTVIGYVVLLIIQYLISNPVKQKKATI